VLEELPGVETAVVDAETDLATVVYDPDAVSIPAMLTAVRKAGYTATVARD
jgi:copper chaperone CopZ